ncbi:MAG: amidohydrolase family protein [Isosphaeraceae bacterium]|nr:amidohydrolase family protein [Isosphaeraceae bacterium]
MTRSQKTPEQVSQVSARHFETGQSVRFTVKAGLIADVECASGPDDFHSQDDWLAPAFWDIQTNGRWGISFSSPDLTAEQVVDIVRAQAALGTAKLCPTLITAPADDMVRGVRAIAAACDRFPDVNERVVGIHLEGPSISAVDGYRGAHPREAVRGPDWDEFERLQEASGGRVVLITLAPERPGAIDFIRRATAAGVTIALGHTAADGATLRAAAEAGARLSTHLGNGIVATLPRHPNPIWEQAALDELSASLIADGHHLDRSTLRVLARAKGPERLVLVSDASPLAGLPPGQYGEWAVDPSGKVVVAGTPYLAGSNQDLDVGLRNLLEATDWTLAQALATVTRNPARVLGKPEPVLRPGAPADLIRFRHDPARRTFELVATCVGGRWIEPGP